MVDSRPKEKTDYKSIFLILLVIMALQFSCQFALSISNNKLTRCGEVIKKYKTEGRYPEGRFVFQTKDNHRLVFSSKIQVGKKMFNKNAEKIEMILTSMQVGDKLCITFNPDNGYIFDVVNL